MKPTIGFKLGILLAAFGILATILTGYYFYISSRNMLTRAAERDLLTATQVVGRNMKITIDVIAEDAQLLAALPLSRNVFLSPDRKTGEQDKQILADTFAAMLSAHPEYFQIRLIGINRRGQELVRVDRNGKRLTRVRGGDLKQRGGYPYVVGTYRLAKGDIYLSDITINHEKGAHSGRDKPTVTVSTPVFAQNGKRLGLIAINVDLNGLARLLKSNLPSSYNLYLSNQSGDFLIHPDPSKTFGFDRGKRILIQDTFKPVLSLIHGNKMNVVTHVYDEAQKQDGHVAAFVRLPFGDTIDKRFVILGLSEPIASITQETSRLGWDTLQIILAFSALALILSALVSRIVTGPLNVVVNAIKNFSKDHAISTLPLTRKDELGLLSRSFHDMQTQIVAHLSELDEHRKALDHQVRHDTLTGLPNRRMFFDRLEHAIVGSRRSGKHLAVLFVDLDRFKEINDTLGHAAGDSVLVNIANLLKSAVREADTVARLGGDEFVILLDSINDPRQAMTVVRKLHDFFQVAMRIDGRELIVHCSIGVSIYPEDGKNADELIQSADQAMYNSKKEGGNTSGLYKSG
ncbi:MAG TPA: GGDEF domain-containing protein [Gallionella sp.]|nr:GGDEF domain-containing protein [Gallionella sp.]